MNPEILTDLAVKAWLVGFGMGAVFMVLVFLILDWYVFWGHRPRHRNPFR